MGQMKTNDLNDTSAFVAGMVADVVRETGELPSRPAIEHSIREAYTRRDGYKLLSDLDMDYAFEKVKEYSIVINMYQEMQAIQKEG